MVIKFSQKEKWFPVSSDNVCLFTWINHMTGSRGWAGPANNFNQQPAHCLRDMTKGKGKATVKSQSPVPSQAASRSGHPRPSASSPSSAIGLNIFCLLLPDDSPSQHIFPVTLHCDWTIGDLKDAIKLKKVNDLRDIDAYKLILYKVVIAAAVFTHAALSLLLLVAQTLDSWRRKHD